MNKIKRHNYIMDQLNKSGSVLVTQISEELDVSTETIRRDLKELENEDKLIRMFGGAYISDEDNKSVPNILKKTFFGKEKAYMAKIAVKHLREENVIFLDSSTTSLAIAEEIVSANLKVTIITNSFMIGAIFGDLKTKVKYIGLGGTYKQITKEFIGAATISSIERYLADYAFISPAAVDSEFGLFANVESSSDIRLTMMKHSKKTIVVVDHTKLIAKSDYRICGIDKIEHLITDKKPNKDFEQIFLDNNITIEY